jgi:hypothetical protein
VTAVGGESLGSNGMFLTHRDTSNPDRSRN